MTTPRRPWPSSARWAWIPRRACPTCRVRPAPTRPAADARRTTTRDMPELDAYKTLQVDPEADEEVIRAAYRGLARKFHPDVAPGPEAAARMADINAAWELIGDPDARRRYDEARLGTSGRATSQATARAGPAPAKPAAPPPPQTVSSDWTSGRSTSGGGYDASMRSAEGLGAAGPPPGRPSGSVLNFGRFAG